MFCFSLGNNHRAATASRPEYLLGHVSGVRPGLCLKVLECIAETPELCTVSGSRLRAQ